MKLNVTAMMTLGQVRDVLPCVAGGAPCYLSIFAGRMADTGRDPVPLMAAAVEMMQPYSDAELIWASPREVLNIFQADVIGCHVITVTNDVLKKLSLMGKDLTTFLGHGEDVLRRCLPGGVSVVEHVTMRPI